jgi:hypothetical protein
MKKITIAFVTVLSLFAATASTNAATFSPDAITIPPSSACGQAMIDAVQASYLDENMLENLYEAGCVSAKTFRNQDLHPRSKSCRVDADKINQMLSAVTRQVAKPFLSWKRAHRQIKQVDKAVQKARLAWQKTRSNASRLHLDKMLAKQHRKVLAMISSNFRILRAIKPFSGKIMVALVEQSVQGCVRSGRIESSPPKNNRLISGPLDLVMNRHQKLIEVAVASVYDQATAVPGL